MRRTRIGLLLACLGLSAGAAEERVYVVRAGESLALIAARLAGDPARWPEIYRANRDQIKDPSLLYPGQRLTIPDLEAPSIRDVSSPPPE